jgi:protein ImuB
MFACIYIPNASGDTAAALVACASTFSPRVETTGSGTVVFDVEGLERLFGGYSEIAEKIREQARERGLEANVAVASNADAAVCAARGFGGVTVIQRGTEAARLCDLPLDVLSPPAEILETLKRWGIRTLGAFARLPAIAVSERLGQEGVKLHKLAQGAGMRPIVPHVDALRFVEVMELDYDIATIEPLTFILSRMLDQICLRLRSRNLATHELRLALGNYVRILNLPLPVRNSRLLTKLFILDLEAHPPGAAIHRVEVEAFPAKPRVTQNGLFVPLSPEPEKLELTLARLQAVVGEENVGSPEILDTHRPDALRIEKFQLSNLPVEPNSPPWQRRGGRDIKTNVAKPPLKERTGAKRKRDSAQPQEWFVQTTDHRWHEPTTPSAPSMEASRYFLNGRSHPSLSKEGNWLPSGVRQQSLTLRLFRPPLEATVQLRNQIPAWIAFHGMHGPIATASGPWHTSGDWWRPTMWDREEWDIEAADALYRIYYDVHLDRWYAQGVYD